MIKVCHFTDGHNRYDGRVFQKECCSLAKAGYEVFLVVCDNLENEVKNNVQIISTGHKPKNRRDRMIKCGKAVFEKAKEIDADVYHFHDPGLLRFALKLKRRGKKVVFDSHEDVSMQLLDAYYIPKFLRKFVANLYCCYAKRIIGKLDGVITVSPHIVTKLEAWNQNTVLVTNYPSVPELCNYSGSKHDKPYVFFAGGISEQWMHDKIIQAIDKLENVDYVLAGPVQGDYMERLKRLPGWNKVTYLGVINRANVDEWYSGCIAGMTLNFCTQLKGIGTLGNNKLFEAMSCQKPVICTNYPLWNDVVLKNNCGICVDPFDVDAIADAIKRIKNDDTSASEMGRNGRLAVEREYNWSTQEQSLINLYEGMIGREK